MAALDLATVRRIAQKEGYDEIYFNEKSLIVSFTRPQAAGKVRVNVYWTTGTVGTCLDHPKQGKTQLFRPNSDLLTLRHIFQNPRLHTDKGYKRRERDSRPGSSQKRQRTGGADPPGDEETELKAALLTIDKERADFLQEIDAERATVASALAALKQRRRANKESARRAAQAASDKEKRRQREAAREELRRQQRKRGTDIWASGSDYQKGLLKSFGRTCSCLALGNEGAYFMIFENGEYNWRGVTSQLTNICKRKTKAAPIFVALGGSSNYFVEFDDGNINWRMNSSFDEAMDSEKRHIEFVALGEDCWFYSCGKEGWKSNGIPNELANLLNGRWGNAKGGLKPWSSAVVSTVALGGDEAYFVRFKDGTSQWNGLGSSLESTIRETSTRQVLLGLDGSWALRHTE